MANGPIKAKAAKSKPKRAIKLKVFISYTQDSSSHNKRVLHLANELRANGFDRDLDQYHANEDWPAWMERSIERAKFVLVVCTPKYQRRWNNNEKPGVGLGAQWESLLTRQHLYEAPGRNEKFVPVVFEAKHKSNIPTPLRNVSRVDLFPKNGFTRLMCRLLNIPPAQKPPVRTSLKPYELAPGFFTDRGETVVASRPRKDIPSTFDHAPFGLRNKAELLYSNLFPVTFPRHIKAAKITLKRRVKFGERFHEMWEELGKPGKLPVDYWIEDGVLYRFGSFAEELWQSMIKRRFIAVLPDKPTSDWASAKKMADKNRFIKLLNRALEGICSSLDTRYKLVWSKHMGCHLFVPEPKTLEGKIKVKAISHDAPRFVYKAIPNKFSANSKAIQHWQHNAFRHYFVRYDNEWFLNIIPFWAFTSDGTGAPSKWQNSSSANMRRPEKNRAVLGHVMFWASILCSSPDIFRSDQPFEVHRPMTVMASPAINDEAWIKIAKDADKQMLMNDLNIEI